MRLLVSGATASVRRFHAPDRLGVLLVPHAGNRLDAALLPELPWAVDNAAFSGFDPAAFCGLLARVAGRPGCRFVACPDVVADAAATARLFEVWQPVIRALGLPVALVGQDGAENAGHHHNSLKSGFPLPPLRGTLSKLHWECRRELARARSVSVIHENKDRNARAKDTVGPSPRSVSVIHENKDRNLSRAASAYFQPRRR